MKSLSFAIGLILSISVYSQQCIPTDNVMWVTEQYTCLTSNCTHYRYDYEYFGTFTFDTVIDGTTYRKLFEGPSKSTYYGALRADSLQAYFVPRDSTVEYIFLDFSLEVGDSIELDLPAPWARRLPVGSTFHVIAKDSVHQFSNANTLTLTLTQFPNVSGPEFEWVYGVGSESGLFNFVPINSISGEGYSLDCLSILDTSIYPDTGLYRCGYGASFSLDDQERRILQITPNPAQERIQVEPLSGHYAIVDLKGMMVKESDFTNHSIDISTLPEGLYIIQIETTDGALCSEKLSIQR